MITMPMTIPTFPEWTIHRHLRADMKNAETATTIGGSASAFAGNGSRIRASTTANAAMNRRNDRSEKVMMASSGVNRFRSAAEP